MSTDIAHLISDACIMTVCDCHKGYWHQELDESSSFVTTFNTEFGCYRYTVMPFGANVAGDVFQSKLDQYFGQITNMIVIADDIMVMARMQNHRNHDKLQYKQTEVKSFRETYTVDGCMPVQSKVKAIVDMPPPVCKKQVQSFIWMVNYLSKLSAHLSELAEPIRELSKEKFPFNWGPQHQESFNLVKKEITTAPILAYYNPRKATVLTTDMSIKGLGSCLLQEGRPVYFASKALTEAQRGYVAIELESLAVAWAMEKFHHFLHANHFILKTEQKLLETILSRTLNQATLHLQGILIRTFHTMLQSYTFLD